MKVYYCSAMDGIDFDIISKEYSYVKKLLERDRHQLVNDFNQSNYERLPLTVENSKTVVHNNIAHIASSDVVLINLSIPNHSYVGCIGEMIYAKQMGIRVIAIVGESGNDKHFWTLYHCDYITNSLEEAMDLL